MIFDSKRKQNENAELEAAQAATVAEAHRPPARSVAPDDVQTAPERAGRGADRDVYPERGVDRSAGAQPRAVRSDSEDLAPLFSNDATTDFRQCWDTVQIGFVDDPRKAVQDADDLVKRVLQSLSETFTRERGHLEAQVAQGGSISTEDLRVALQRYRAFLHRLLSL